MTAQFILNDLKTHTHDWHIKTEGVAYAEEIKTGTFRLDQYADLLQKNYFIHQQLEHAYLNSSWNLTTTVDLLEAAHSRLPSLQKDLSQLDQPTRQLFPISYDKRYHTPAQFIGHLYVVEGSGMGGRMIANLLAKQKSFAAAQPFHFFTQTTSPSLRMRWQNLGRLAERYITNQEEQQWARSSAVDVFRFFYQVYKQA